MLSLTTRTQLPRLRSYLISSSTRLSSTTSSHQTKSPSEDNETGASDGNSMKQDELQLLYDAALSKVVIHGWSEKAIEAAVVDLGWSIAAKRMISRGAVQVAEEFVRRCNRDLAQLLQTEDAQAILSQDNVVGRATYAIRERIKMNDPYHASWAKALALQALPQNSLIAVRNSAHMVDEIAHYAGYSAPDISWYMDRSVLGVTYHATELYWLTDTSPGKADTWRFLERKLQGSHAFRSGISSSLENMMTLADVASGSASSIFKSMRRSY